MVLYEVKAKLGRGAENINAWTNVETINERQKCSPEMDISFLDKS